MNLKPVSLNPEPQPLRADRAGSALRAIAILGAVMLAAGTAVELLHVSQSIAACVRWTGFALFVPYAVRRRSLLVWTFFAMLAGAELGVDAPHAAVSLRVFADLFLRLVRMIVAPLIFGGIVTGIAGHGELRGVGRVALKAMVFFEVVTTLGLLIGAIAANISQVGAGLALPPQTMAEAASQAGHAQTWQQMLLEIFPENIAQAVAQNQVLQVAVFALLFGVALAMLPTERSAPLVTVLQALTETMFRLTRFIMVLAPLAAGAALAYAVGSMGVASLLPLLKLLAVFYIALRRCRGRACGDRFCNNHVRGRITAGHGAHGGLRHSALDRLVRHSHRLQLQHDRVQRLRIHGRALCRAGCGHAPHGWRADDHAAYANAYY
jgi:proton glutamate symport protein